MFRNVFVFVQLMNNLIKELSRALKFQLKLNAMNEQILHIYRKNMAFHKIKYYLVQLRNCATKKYQLILE